MSCSRCERIGDTLVAYGLGDFLGTAFARQPWPGRIGCILTVDVSADLGMRGKIAAYRMHPFMRLRASDHERLVPVKALEGGIRGKVERQAEGDFWRAVRRRVKAAGWRLSGKSGYHATEAGLRGWRWKQRISCRARR